MRDADTRHMDIPRKGRPDRRRLEPLWARVDRNRIALAGYVALFVTSAVVVLDLLLAIAMSAVYAFMLLSADNLATATSFSALPDGRPLYLTATVIFAVAALSWALLVIARSERWLLKRLSAVFVAHGDQVPTKLVLKDMALAAGLPVAPTLHLLDTDNVNAFVFSARRRRAVIGVTRGFIDRLGIDEQRAVFAHLVARVRSRDTAVATWLAALMSPLYAWQGAWQRRQDDEMDSAMLASMMRPGVPAELASAAAGQTSAFVFFAFPLVVALVVVNAVFSAAHRTTHRKQAEKADAEGMLLLKDPSSMLSALERCVRLNNFVPRAAGALGDLFYCWPGSESTDDEDDPEWLRVARLREVLGVEGAVFANAASPSADDVADLIAPLPPRLF